MFKKNFTFPATLARWTAASAPSRCANLIRERRVMSLGAGKPCRLAVPSTHQAAMISWRDYATKQVQHKAGSDTLKEMGENAKEELGSVKETVLDIASGGQQREGAHQGPETFGDEVKHTVGGVAGLLSKHVPREAWLFGSAGVLPYIATSLTSIYLARQATLTMDKGSSAMDLDTAMALLYHVETIQIAYGAIILSFLGAIHWGLEFAKFGGEQGLSRYALGILPVLLAWPTLLLNGQVALATQFGSFALMWWLDMKATTNGWTPKWYSTYRFFLSMAVGIAILTSLAGTSLLGPSHKDLIMTDTLGDVRRRTHELQADMIGEAPGYKGTTKTEFRIDPANEAYGVIRNINEEAEETKKKREEEEKEKRGNEESKSEETKSQEGLKKKTRKPVDS